MHTPRYPSMYTHAVLRELGIGLLLMVMLASTQQAHADFELTLRANRNVVNIGETLTISVITQGDSSPNGEPPFANQLNGFDLLARSSSTDIRISGGRKERRSVWAYTVQPIRSGTIQISPFQWQGKSSNALTIQVTDPNAATSAKPQANTGTTKPQVAAKPPPAVIIESEVDQKVVPVRAQLLYTMRIMHRTPIGGKINQPPFSDSEVLTYPLGEKSSQKIISNVRYSVREWRYAVFPQRSGTLNIPPASLDGYHQHTRKRVRRKSKTHKIEVLPSPSSFAASEWLAAKNVVLQEEWSTSPDKPLPIGQPITRKIIIRADGLPAEQLPALAAIDIPNIKTYPEQPDIKTESHYSGMQGQRIETMVLIPAYAGNVTLPSVQIRWWDTKRGGIQTAELPARQLNIVSPNVPSSDTHLQLAEQGDETVTVTDAGLSNLPPSNAPTVAPARPSWTWWLFTLFTASAWPVLLWQTWHKRRKKLLKAQEAHELHRAHHHTQKKLLEQATHGARQNNHIVASDALLEWARHRWPEEPPSNLPEIAKRTNSDALSNAVQQLNRIRYQEERKEWNGVLLAEAIQGLQKRAQNPKSNKHALAELYP